MSLIADGWILVLLPPLLLAWWRWGAAGYGRWWRLALLLVVVAAAVQPQLRFGGGGRDLIVVLDRSASMGPVLADQEEILRLAGSQRAAGDRLAVVAFGAHARVVQGSQATALPALMAGDDAAGASDLAAALERAAALIEPGRSVRVLLHSDGAYTDRDPRPAVAELAMAGARFDVLPVERPGVADAAILAIELPEQLRLGNSFVGAVRFLGDRHERRAYRIVRDDLVVREGVVTVHPDRVSVVSFADRPPGPGLARYTVELDDADDARPGNNRARAALRVVGGEQVVVMSGDGSPGTVAAALTAAGMRVRSLPEGPVTVDDLSGAAVLVLDQVPAAALGTNGREAIAAWVRNFGGGLLLGGGRRSFGAGGYHRTPIEAVLPVTMELRDEHRRYSVGLAVALDRSGSMMAPAGGGLTKMDLANRGTAAAIEALGANDQVAVFAVDTAPHTVVPLSTVGDGRESIDRVLRIESMGGGIFVYEALVAASRALLASDRATRHIVLFSDAADSERPGDYRTLLADLRRAGITVSVVALGSEGDSDARLLIDIAERGGGRCVFTQDAADLPRLFTQETLLVARSAWIDGPVPVAVAPTLPVLLGGDPALHAWPAFDGANLCYARPQAQVLAVGQGDPESPLLSVWQHGTGRSAALALACDDDSQPTFAAWEGYAPLLAGCVRWLAADGGAAPASLLSEIQGGTVVFTVEYDPLRRQDWPRQPPVIALLREDGAVHQHQARPIDDGRFQVAVPLGEEQVLLSALLVGDRVVPGPALQLPYSPEHAPRRGREDGGQVLADLARLGGGSVRTDLRGLYGQSQSPGQGWELTAWLVAVAVALLLVEVAVRRLQLSLPGGLLAALRGRLRAMRAWSRRGGSSNRRPIDRADTEPPAVESGPPPAQQEDPAVAPSGGMRQAMEELRRRRGR